MTVAITLNQLRISKWFFLLFPYYLSNSSFKMFHYVFIWLMKKFGMFFTNSINEWFFLVFEIIILASQNHYNFYQFDIVSNLYLKNQITYMVFEKYGEIMLWLIIFGSHGNIFWILIWPVIFRIIVSLTVLLIQWLTFLNLTKLHSL